MTFDMSQVKLLNKYLREDYSEWYNPFYKR
jgi:hypothetical protein